MFGSTNKNNLKILFPRFFETRFLGARFSALMLLLFFGMCFGSHASAVAKFTATSQQTLLITDQNQTLKLIENARWFIDHSGRLSIYEIQSPEQPWNQPGLKQNLGLQGGDLWLKISIDTNLSQKSSWVLDLGTSSSLSSNLFIKFNGETFQIPQENLSAESTSTSKKGTKIYHRHYYDIPFNASGRHQLYIQLKSAGILSTPAVLWPEAQFHQQEFAYQFFNGVFFGAIFLLGIYSFVIGVFARNWAYIFYALFAAASAQMLASVEGLSLFWLFPNTFHWNSHSLVILAWLAVSASLLMTVYFFENRDEIKRYGTAFHFLTLVTLLAAAIAALFDQQKTLLLSHLAVLLIYLLLSWLSTRIWLTGCVYARFYLLAFITFVAAQLTWVGLDLGWITSYGYLEALPKVLTLIGVIALRLALTDKHNEERKEQIQSQQQAVLAVALQQKAQTRLSFIESHDAVTGMPNRVAFKRLYTRHQDMPQQLGIAVIRLPRFAEINKALGRQQGDQVLIALAHRIEQVISNWPSLIAVEDEAEVFHNLAHIGGVSFAFIFAMTDEMPPIKQSAEALIKSLREPVGIADFRVDPQAVMGLSVLDKDVDFTSAMQQASAACDAAVNQDQSFALYNDEMDPYGSRRLTLLADLRVAANNKELSLTFQPQISVHTHEVTAFEALIRWNHPQLGPIAPSEFLTLAEETEVITSITYWVIRNAIATIRKVHEAGYKLKVGINLSAKSLKDQQLIQVLEETRILHDVPAEAIVLEITETAMLEDSKHARDILNQFNKMGYVVSIDDFGTGYSSLTYLKELPAKELKIDRSFVEEMEKNNSDFIIVNTTVNMAKSLDLEVVVEGVESAESLDLLSKLDANYAQGYFISHPIPEDQLLEWLQTYEPI